ncbi:hypothetical protein D3C87_1983090 [compost metagenome]
MARSRTGRRLPKPRAEQANNNAAANTNPMKLMSKATPRSPAVTQAAPAFPSGTTPAVPSVSSASSRKPPETA